MLPADRLCTLVFDEVTIKEFLKYASGKDKIDGFKDLGELGSSHFIVKGRRQNYLAAASIFSSQLQPTCIGNAMHCS